MSAARWRWWAVCSVLGLALVALPDSDSRLFSFSRLHGPSLVDAVGALFLTAGWLCLDQAVWRHRHRLATRVGRRGLAAGASAYVFGLAVLVVSVLGDIGWWWVLGAVLLAGVQLAAAGAVTRLPAGPRPG